MTSLETLMPRKISANWRCAMRAARGLKHDTQSVRYIDRYRRDGGKWRFARRTMRFDMKMVLPADDHGAKPDPGLDARYCALSSLLFQRGAR